MFESYLDLIEKYTLSEVYDSNTQVVKVGSKIYKKVLDSNNIIKSWQFNNYQPN